MIKFCNSIVNGEKKVDFSTHLSLGLCQPSNSHAFGHSCYYATIKMPVHCH